MRRVIVFKREWDSKINGSVRVEDGEAIFHQFGINYEEFESGPGQLTTAIIEREDGTVQNVDATLIQFIKESA